MASPRSSRSTPSAYLRPFGVPHCRCGSLALGVLEPGFEVSEPASEETVLQVMQPANLQNRQHLAMPSRPGGQPELTLFAREEGSGFRRLEDVRGIGSDALNLGGLRSFGDR